MIGVNQRSDCDTNRRSDGNSRGGPLDDLRRNFEIRLLDQADKIRIVLVGFFLLAYMTAPPESASNSMMASIVVAFAALYTVFTRFVLDWRSIRREGHVHLMAGLLVCTDILFISVFLWAMDAAFTSLGILFVLDAVFTAAFFSGFELAIVVGIACGAQMVVALWSGRDISHWQVISGISATLVVGWMAYALAEVIRRERARTERVIECLTEGVLLLTSEGDVAVLNPRIERMFGVDAEEILGLNIYDAKCAEALAPLSDIIADARAATADDSHPGTSARELHTPGPEPRVVSCLTVRSAGRNGQTNAWVVVCRDITDVVSTVRAKEEGIAVLSHELRGRLQSVAASSQLLTEESDATTPEEQADLIEALHAETNRLMMLIRRTLEASAVEDSSDVFEFQSVDLGTLAADACEGLQAAAQEHQLQLRFEAQEDIPPVRGDPTRLDQVLQNLIENALKFTPTPGNVRVAVTHGDGRVQLDVSDTGCGVAGDQINGIFEKFARSQVDDTHPPKGGLGLGLYVSREIIRRHGGTIGVESSVGKGSVFSFSLPAIKDVDGDDEATTAPHTEARK